MFLLDETLMEKRKDEVADNKSFRKVVYTFKIRGEHKHFADFLLNKYLISYIWKNTFEEKKDCIRM